MKGAGTGVLHTALYSLPPDSSHSAVCLWLFTKYPMKNTNIKLNHILTGVGAVGPSGQSRCE